MRMTNPRSLHHAAPSATNPQNRRLTDHGDWLSNTREQSHRLLFAPQNQAPRALHARFAPDTAAQSTAEQSTPSHQMPSHHSMTLDNAIPVNATDKAATSRRHTVPAETAVAPAAAIPRAQ